jgi:putative cell wall-binding protein
MFPVAAKADVMVYVSNGTDADLGTLAVGEKLDIDISTGVDRSKFYNAWTPTSSLPDPYWTSSNSAVVEITDSRKGILTAKGAGTAIITATFTFSNPAKPVQLFFTVTVVAKKTTPSIVRYGGGNRYDTANLISSGGWPTGCTNVVLVSGTSYPDALIGAPLARLLDAPILLTSGKELETTLLNQIKGLKASNVYILGGESSVSDKVRTSLAANFKKVERYSGGNRYDTALIVAQEIDKLNGFKAKHVFVATGSSYPDALAISPYAAMKGYPILYASIADANNAITYGYLASDMDVAILGGASTVTTDFENTIKTKVKSVSRISGGNRYETALSIAMTYQKDFLSNDIVLATGTNFPDALSGGAFGGKKGLPLLLVNNNTSLPIAIETFIRTRNPSKIYLLGGGSSVSEDIVKQITG